MAENREDTSRDDLTEEASPHRLEEYRRKGMVAQSKEVTSLAVFLAVGTATYLMSTRIGYQLSEMMRQMFMSDRAAHLDLNSPMILSSVFITMRDVFTATGIPICIAGFIFGILGSLLQIGPIFTFEPLEPDFSKVDPIQGFKKLVSLRQIVEGAKLIFKIAIISAIAYILIKNEIQKVPEYFGADLFQILAGFGSIVQGVSLSFLGILIGFAAIDFIYQKYEYQKELRMTKLEAKQEHKEREGDPQVKARIRSIQREMARKRMMQAVKKADVIVTNPTHIAIALVYNKESMSAPKVVAKGADHLAEKIKAIAAEAGVPRVENVPLARALYKSVKVGQVVPRALYQAVAEVLAYVYRLRRMKL